MFLLFYFQSKRSNSAFLFFFFFNSFHSLRSTLLDFSSSFFFFLVLIYLGSLPNATSLNNYYTVFWSETYVYLIFFLFVFFFFLLSNVLTFIKQGRIYTYFSIFFHWYRLLKLHAALVCNSIAWIGPNLKELDAMGVLDIFPLVFFFFLFFGLFFSFLSIRSSLRVEQHSPRKFHSLKKVTTYLFGLPLRFMICKEYSTRERDDYF